MLSQAGFSGGKMTRERPPDLISPVCACTLVIVPEELERQWQNELRNNSTLRHRVVLTRGHVRTLKRDGVCTANHSHDFPTSAEMRQLDVVVRQPRGAYRGQGASKPERTHAVLWGGIATQRNSSTAGPGRRRLVPSACQNTRDHVRPPPLGL